MSIAKLARSALELVVAVLLPAASRSSARAAGYTAHEWGTFTVMQGPDGGVLEGLNHEEESLPPWVHSYAELERLWLERLRQGSRGRAVSKGIPVGDPVIGVNTKMETPVIYFHGRVPARIRVKVEFRNGLLSQFFPKALLSGLPGGLEAIDLTKIGSSTLNWDLGAFASTPSNATRLWPTRPDDPWLHARNVDAADVYAGHELERFVFYRGLGHLSLPFSVHAEDDDSITIRNDGRDDSPAAFAMQMNHDGRARFATLGPLRAGSAVALQWADTAIALAEESVATARAAVKEALVEQKLHADEAEAMVATWSRGWFQSQGTRIFYFVPRALTDEILPLTIAPAPDEVVRVMVGRIELVTPEDERFAIEAIRDSHSPDRSLSIAAWQRLQRFGRFLEPVARRVAALATDPHTRTAALAIADDESRKP